VASTSPELKRFQEKKNTIQENRMKLINEIFDMWDLDGDNKVKSNEIRPILCAMGREPTHDNIMDFLFIADKDNTGIINKEDFMKALDEVFSLPEDAVDQAIDAFKFFDIDNSGKINQNVLKDILLKFVDGYSEKDVQNIFKLINFDMDGNFDYEEFITIWKFQ
jgi:Ca2+-binding EF-hand superfamily protein